MALPADDHLVSRTREHLESDLVRHRPGRQPDGRLLAEERGAAVLKLVDARILVELIVADGRCSYRPPHRIGGTSHGVGTEVDWVGFAL
jgi:hypothetical protein